MGMFDTIRYKNHEYQTKDTPMQGLEMYEIRGDQLWFKRVERQWVDDTQALFGGYLEELSHEWIFCEDFDGAIRFYREDKDYGGWQKGAWIEYKTLFMNGKMIKCERVGK